MGFKFVHHKDAHFAKFCIIGGFFASVTQDAQVKETLPQTHFRVATVREKYLENEIFSRSGKDLESQGKVREFENSWLWQAVFRKFIYSVQEGKGCSLR